MIRSFGIFCFRKNQYVNNNAAFTSTGGTNALGGGGGEANDSGGVTTGGSGVIIIAYPSTFPAATATTGSPTVDTTTRAGYRVYRWTGSGSITL